MNVRMLVSEVHEEELLLHLARLPAPRSRATVPEAVEATLACVRDVFAAHVLQALSEALRTKWIPSLYDGDRHSDEC
jgi:archaeosine-15-forming tRNA-guanine transglycosylase